MADVKWLINRLRTMSPGEIGYRTNQFVKKKIEKKRLTIPKSQLVSVHQPQVSLPFDFSSFKLDFDRPFHFFGLQIDLSKTVNFHYDISSGKEFPLGFSKEINIRSDAFGSAKVVWEVNRLQFLLPMLIEYKKTGELAQLHHFVRLMTDWNNQNRYLSGVNWYSNIEVNIRLINWYFCWQLLADDKTWNEDPAFKKFTSDIWIPLIYQHCYYSYHNPSYYSSANNHLISEYAGLFVASCLWKFPESEKWLAFAKKGLEKEIVVQHSENGINKEEAAEYIQFITDFFLLSYVAGKQHGVDFSASYVNALGKICEYIYTFLDAKGNFPKYGDEDDGRVILPDLDTHSNNFISILNTAAVLLKKPQWKRPDAAWDIKSELLTAFVNGKNTWSQITPTPVPAKSTFYPAEGHFYFKDEMEGQEIYAHMDAAQLGFLSIAAHGHADALSFFLNVDGFPFLVDPGTFTYHTHPAWRAYFVSTLAHNTIGIEKVDQAKLAGPTMWLQHFNTNVESWEQGDKTETVTASHDGYQRLGISHKRTMIYDKSEKAFSLIDDVAVEEGKNADIAMPFHFHPKVQVKQTGPLTYLLSRPDDTKLQIQIELSANFHWEYKKATEQNPLGWYSASFMVKEPSSLLLGRTSINKSIIPETKIKIVSTL